MDFQKRSREHRITVKNIFLATVLVLGSLGFVGNVGAYYKNKAGNIFPVKGDKFEAEYHFYNGASRCILQVNKEGRLELQNDYENEQNIFTVKEIVTLHQTNGSLECFKLETCNNKELKLIKSSNGYVIEESSEKNKSIAQDGWFRFDTYEGYWEINCFPNGKIERKTKIVDGKETDSIIRYYINAGENNCSEDRRDAVVSTRKQSFEITFLTPETSAPQEKITVQEVKKATPENIKEKVVIQEYTVTPKAKEDGNQLEEMTRKLEEQLEINRKLQEEINNLKAGKSSDTAIIEEESKPVVSSKQSQSSRVSAPRQGARGRGQTQRK
jgi:hypothetical protein